MKDAKDRINEMKRETRRDRKQVLRSFRWYIKCAKEAEREQKDDSEYAKGRYEMADELMDEMEEFMKHI